MSDRSSTNPALETYQHNASDEMYGGVAASELAHSSLASCAAAVRNASLGFALLLAAIAFADYALGLYHDMPVAAVSAALLAVICGLGAAILTDTKKTGFVQFVVWQLSVISALAIVNIVRPEIQPFGHHGPLWANVVNLTMERNLPTFYSSYLLVLVALAVVMCGRRERTVKAQWERDRYVWPFLALGFLFLAFDETFMVHEALNDFLRRHLSIPALHGNYWTLVYFPIGVAALIVCVPWGLRLIVREPVMVAILAVAVALEVLSPILEIAGVTFAKQNTLYKISATIEETAEMLAAVTFFVAFARHESLLTRFGVRDPETAFGK